MNRKTANIGMMAAGIALAASGILTAPRGQGSESPFPDDLFKNDPPAKDPHDFTEIERRAAAHINADIEMKTLDAVLGREVPVAQAITSRPEPVAALRGDLPDRLSVDDRSPFYGPTKGIGVRLDGKVRPDDVIEYCVSEGWVRIMRRMANGKPIRERGRYVGTKFHGVVEPFWKGQ